LENGSDRNAPEPLLMAVVALFLRSDMFLAGIGLHRLAVENCSTGYICEYRKTI
jgi:hypothetical protein